MPLITTQQLQTHLYAEVIAEIVRDDATIADTAIAAAEGEVAGYLGRFDVQGMFTTPSTASGIGLANLQRIVKDVACWHLVKLANPNINIELFRTLYEDAIAYLEKVMKGQTDPPGWPPAPDDPDTPNNEAGAIEWTSNPKRTNHF